MRVAFAARRRLTALVQFALFAFSASTSLLPCAYEMSPSASEQVTVGHHAVPTSHASHQLAVLDTTEPGAPIHHAPASPMSSETCPWVVGCTGMVQFAFETTWRLVETTPVVAAPVGVTLRPATAERDVESPPPRA